MKNGFCPQCNESPVVRIKTRGTFPRCAKCLEANKRGRYDRVNKKRRDGEKDGHRNAEGKRYADSATLVLATCKSCRSTFHRSSRLRGRAVCASCTDQKAEVKRLAKLEAINARYRQDPARAKRGRLAKTLQQAGLSIEWYDAIPQQCGICGTTDPGRGWCLDHDHSCCPYGTRQGCSKCIRGLLCAQCNTGLGMFRDDAENLKAAISWLEKHAKRPSETAA